MLLEDDHLVAEGHEVVGDSERRGPGPDADDAPPRLGGGNHRQPVGEIASEVGGHALEAADGDRGAVDPAPAAGRLAGPVAGAPRIPGKTLDSRLDMYASVYRP